MKKISTSLAGLLQAQSKLRIIQQKMRRVIIRLRKTNPEDPFIQFFAQNADNFYAATVDILAKERDQANLNGNLILSKDVIELMEAEGFVVELTKIKDSDQYQLTIDLPSTDDNFCFV